MLNKEICIINKVGLHARPAAKMVQECKKLNCKVEIEKLGKRADAKSITAIMQLGVKFNECINVYIQGNDETEEKKALAKIESLVEDKFGERE